MITKEQLKDEINTVEDSQTLERLYQLLLKIKQGAEPKKQPQANSLLENMQTEDDFFNAAGLWKDRDISQESLRAQAWRNNEQ